MKRNKRSRKTKRSTETRGGGVWETRPDSSYHSMSPFIADSPGLSEHYLAYKEYREAEAAARTALLLRLRGQKAQHAALLRKFLFGDR